MISSTVPLRLLVTDSQKPKFSQALGSSLRGCGCVLASLREEYPETGSCEILFTQRRSQKPRKENQATSDAFDLDQNVVERGTGAKIRQALRGDIVGIVAVACKLLPPDRKRHHHALPRLLCHTSLDFKLTSIIEDAHAVSRRDSPRARIFRVNLEHRLLLRMNK